MNALEIRGINRITDNIGQEVVRGARAAVKLQKSQGSDVEFVSKGRLIMEGEFGFDKEGKFGFVGRVDTLPPTLTLPIKASTGIDTEHTWRSEGAGTMTVTFEISITVKPKEGES